jgi:membrane protease YdiL (CAAX protease family)
LGFYVFLVFIGLPIYAIALSVTGYLITAAGSTFGAGITANALSVRVFERGSLVDVGLGWRMGSARNLGVGTAAGLLSAAAVTLLPVAAGMADLVPDPSRTGSLASGLFVALVLLFGAVGEELIFRGYGFQVLFAAFGPAVSLALSSLLFGVVHMSNLNASPLGIVNTVGFGVVLGYAVLRSRELWLAIGIHFGWNLLLPLVGGALSGFKIGVTGYVLRWNVPEIWSGGAYGPEASVLTCGVIAALLLFLRRLPVTGGEALMLARHRPEA